MDRFTFEKYGMYFGVYENVGEEKKLICLCTYKKGAVECCRRLNEMWRERKEVNCI